MGDYFQTIIDTQAGMDEAPELAQHLVSFLAGKGIVEPTPSAEGGYPRGPRALAISVAPRDQGPRIPDHEPIPPNYFHLQVVVGRMTHPDTMSAFEPSSAACPRCRKEIEDLEADWSTAAQDWMAGDNDASLSCSGCGASSPVTGWIYKAGYGFGNLAFRFWNWPPFTPAFLDEVRRELGHRIVLVGGKF